jgi:O-antigen/teichoic acid export membrane protein
MAGNAAWRLTATVVRVAVGLVAVSVFTRLLGITQWGLLALFQAAVAPLALFDGLGRATVKYVSESLARGDLEAAAGVVRTALALNLALGAFGAGALLLAAPWLATTVFAIPPDEVARAVVGFRVMAGAWFVGVLTATYAAVLAAHQRYDEAAKLGSLAVIASTASGLAAAAWTRDVVAVVVAQAIAAVVVAAVYRARAAGLLAEAGASPRPDRTSLRRALSFWRWEVVGVAGGLLTGWADRYLLGAFLGPTVVGFYAVALVLHSQLYGAFVEMGEVLFPTVSHLEGRGDLVAARRLTLLVGWTLTTGFGICAVALAIVGGDFLQLWVSREAALAATATLRLLCVGGIVALTAIAPLYYTLGLGRTRWDAAAGVLVGATVTGLGLALVPRFGLPAVAYALIGGALVRCGLVVLMWRVHFRAQFGIGAFAAHVWAPAAVSIATLWGLTRLHDAIAREPTWPWFLLEGVVAVAVAAAIQLGISELLPGGRERRRDVVSSFRPVVSRWLGRAPPVPEG